MKYSIKKRLQIILMVLTCISILVCMMVAYFYSNNQLRSHILSNEEKKLELIVSELDDVATDVQQVGMLLAFDEYVQSYFKGENLTVSDRINLQETIKNKMKNYILQRDYIVNFLLMDGERMLLSNSQHVIYVDENDYKKLMEQSIYSEWGAEGMEFQYGPSYSLKLHAQKTGTGMEMVTVMPYIIDVSDKDNVRNKIGRILVNVGYEYLYRRIENGLKDTDDFLFFDSYREKIFQMEDVVSQEEQTRFLQLFDRAEDSLNQVKSFKTDRGYFICFESGQSGWLLATYISKNTIFKKSEGLLFLYLGIAFVMILAVILISRRIADSITRPIIALTNTVQEITEGNTSSRVELFLEDEIGVLAEKFNAMITELNKSYEKNLALEKESRRIELDLLSAQINPHFVYNTLQTIIYLAAKNENEAVMKLTRSFVGLLQNTVKISEKRLEVELWQEIEAVKGYIDIQNYRYKNKFSVLWEIEPETEHCLVPKTSLQPIVENSLLHGIFNVDDGEIRIRTYCQSDLLYIVVKDNGIGMSREKIRDLLNSKSTNANSMRTIGIPNVISRIHYLYGEQYGVWIESEVNSYTKITMIIPESSEKHTK